MPIVDSKFLIKCPPDAVIWRYIDLNKFELLLKDESLFLCRSDKFPDPYEGSIPTIEVQHRVKHQLRMAARVNQAMTVEEAKAKSGEIGESTKNISKHLWSIVGTLIQQNLTKCGDFT